MPSQHPALPIFINHTRYELTSPDQSGRALKELARIPLGDALFLEQPHDDAIIGNDDTVTLRPGAHLHSQPPADYGQITAESLGVAEAFSVLPQPGGWVFLILERYVPGNGYEPGNVRVLVKLPPTFPDARPDMFWVSPAVRTRAGTVPAGATDETLLGTRWQRFSWHLKEGAWVPGVSTLRDYMRVIRARFERGN
jgi:hypothetical protein